MSGGKGGSQSTQVKIPEWLESAAKSNIARGEHAASIGYVPYYGPDVAAFTPMQNAAFSNTADLAQSFGMATPTGNAMDGMPAPQTFAGGIQGYSSGALYDQALAELKRRNPGQYAAITSMFINPQTGAPPTWGSGTGVKPPASGGGSGGGGGGGGASAGQGLPSYQDASNYDRFHGQYAGASDRPAGYPASVWGTLSPAQRAAVKAKYGA